MGRNSAYISEYNLIRKKATSLMILSDKNLHNVTVTKL